MNFGSRASYRYGGRGPLPTDPVVTPMFKALTGDVPETRSLIEPPALRSTQHSPLDLNRSRLILKTQKLRTKLNTISQ
jgi:hypothetical protein